MDRTTPAQANEALRLRDEAIALLREMPELRNSVALGLCGSVARGTAGARSDIDVFVIVTDRSGSRKEWMEEEERWWAAVRRALAPLERDTSVIVYTPRALRKISNWYVLRLASDALFVHDTDGMIAALLRRVREKALASGFVERELDGRPFWEYTGDVSKGWKLELEDE